MGSFSIWHWLIVLAVVLLLFGRGKIPELMGDVAKGIKSFKKGMSEDETETAAKERRALDHSDGDVVARDVKTEKSVS
ncbi:MAG TPA: twin-arginine translocase TatA/TatE family subunit [Aurantimonas sp.]|jgi:sec-independent protein translocase protein TatA|nr:twin-arginine translocase TatA/TatE family subunit [Aurantimonas sp.]